MLDPAKRKCFGCGKESYSQVVIFSAQKKIGTVCGDCNRKFEVHYEK